MSTFNSKIAVLGVGNIGHSIVSGMIMDEVFSPGNIHATRTRPEKITDLKEKGVIVSSDNKKAVSEADIVIVAVKPFRLEKVLKEIKDDLNPQKQILISVVTGISLNEIETILGYKMPVFRIMPNIAISIRESMTCFCALNATEKEIRVVSEIFNELGKAISISEELMDASTVLGACGVAYVLRFIRAMMQGGIEIGFDAETAATIAYQTVKGTGELLMVKGQHPEREIDRVTTPKGCTIAGLNEMEHQGFSSSLIKGIITSFSKI